MSLAAVRTRAWHGLDAPPVTVEVHLSGGLPGLAIVGLVETAVRESRERVRAAIAQSGFDFPNRKITVNLAPADLPKAGGRFDLAIAVGILAASGQLPPAAIEGLEFYGELAFSGAIRGVPALLPALVHAGAAGHTCIVPAACSADASLAGGTPTLLAADLVAVLRHLQGDPDAALSAPIGGQQLASAAPTGDADLADVRGQPLARRALEVAAAGNHNFLMLGPPGTGKTMLARRLPGILPPLDQDELLQVAMIRSVLGRNSASVLPVRPFRAPHHSASVPALVGGGQPARPGEVSLAHNGVLFLDELPEFARNAIEALREPLETGEMTVARAAGSVRFPACFQLVAAMNPCRCGYFGDPVRPCICSPAQVQSYRQKISGPFADRIDITLKLMRPQAGLSLAGDDTQETSAAVRDRVLAARTRQLEQRGVLNARFPIRFDPKHGLLNTKSMQFLSHAATKFGLSERAIGRIMRVARTIADLAGETTVNENCVAEALALRTDLQAEVMVG